MINLINNVSKATSIPVVGLGGAQGTNDFYDLISKTNVSAVAASSTFIFHGKHDAVLISYPSYSELEHIFKEL